MSAVIDEDRVTFAEQMGRAANASDLTVRESGGQVDALIALGMTLADLERHPGKRPELKEIERQLVPVMWRMKAGEQTAYFDHAVALFAEWMIRKGRFKTNRINLCQLFAGQALKEWLNEVCPHCKGSGVLERKGLLAVRPTGSGIRNALYVLCARCHGTKRASPKHGRRCEALAMSYQQYDADDWKRTFAIALSTLDSLSGRLDRPLAKRFRKA